MRVDIGQLLVLLADADGAYAVQLAVKSASERQLFRPAFVITVAAVMELVGLYWTFQRVGVLAE